MDGIASVSARISEIQSRLAVLPTMGQSVGGGQATTQAQAGMFSLGAAQGLPQGMQGPFAELLTQAITGAMGGASGELNADGIPVEFARYGNGRIPESLLAPINGSNERLWAPAAAQLNRMIADAKAQGISIGVTDGYRDYDGQVRVAASKGLYSQGGLAAAPGTSKHGWGLAVDLRLDSAAQSWMRTHGPRYGFHENVAREPWHWEFTPR